MQHRPHSCASTPPILWLDGTVPHRFEGVARAPENCFPLVTSKQWMNIWPLIRHDAPLSTIHTPTMTIPSLHEVLWGVPTRKVARR